MEKINLVELLRDCPTGMELDCTLFDNVTFVRVDNNKKQFPIEIAVSGLLPKYLTKEGCFHDTTHLPEAKCIIFPKGKTTWEGFHKAFKDGDILTSELGSIFILKESNVKKISYGCYIAFDYASCIIKNCTQLCSKKGCRFATEEEKQKLFDAIKANGYKWNAETKTLEKLIEPNFKVGDRIRHKEKTKWACTIARVEDRYYVDGHPTCYTLPFGKQNEYELIPHKFDITTLKPFESRVLVRDYDNRIWIPTFWGKYLEDSNCRYLTVNGCYKYCIPYEGNWYLLGTTNDCDDFYKTWE